jgi:hypothetical protein
MENRDFSMRRIAPPEKQEGHKPPKKTKRPVAQIKVPKGNWTFMDSMYTPTVLSCKHT